MLILLMLAVVACDDPEPELEGQPAVSSPGPTTTATHTSPAPTLPRTNTPTTTPVRVPTAEPTPSSVPTATPAPMSSPTPRVADLAPTNTSAPIDEEDAAVHLAETIPWLLDPSDNEHVEVVAALTYIWLRDADVGDAVARLPWLADGVDEEEFLLIRSVRSLVNADLDVASMAVTVPWLGDEVTLDEYLALKALASLTYTDLQLAESIVALPWFIDDIRRTEPVALNALTRISSTDFELAKRILRWPRFADDITMVESVALHALGEIALLEPELASHWGEYAINGMGDLRLHLLPSIFDFAEMEAGSWERLTEETWFADGLDEEETAFVTVLGRTAKNHPQLYSDLLQNRFTRARSVLLPLAGEVKVWVFQRTPLPRDDVLMSIEDAMRAAEELIAVPFPTTDVILLLGGGGFHLGSFMGLTGSDTGEVAHVPHETAHYYFGHSFPGPAWFIEGGAEFVEALVNDQTGTESLGDRKIRLRNGNYAYCIDELKIENLLHLNDLGSGDGSCEYHMGEYFLLNLYETLGQEAMSAALKELSVSLLTSDSKFLASGFLGDPGWEERIFHSLLRHTPPDRRDEFLELYERLHGGTFVFAETRS